VYDRPQNIQTDAGERYSFFENGLPLKTHKWERFMEDRLVELETKTAFLDKTIEELNDVTFRQQQQLDQLSKDVEIIKEQLRMLTTSLPAGLRE